MGVFTVTKLSEGPVRPSAATPSGTLPMAWVDRYPTHRGLVESAHIYRNVDDMPAPAAEREAGGTGTEADAAGAWTRRRFAPAPAPSLRGHRRCVLFLAESRALSPDGEEGDWDQGRRRGTAAAARASQALRARRRGGGVARRRRRCAERGPVAARSRGGGAARRRAGRAGAATRSEEGDDMWGRLCVSGVRES